LNLTGVLERSSAFVSTGFLFIVILLEMFIGFLLSLVPEFTAVDLFVS
jgi:hypothetical protein